MMVKYKLNVDATHGAQMLARHDGRWYSAKDVDTEIATLRAENERLREALRVFADAYDESIEDGYDEGNQAPISVEDCRIAKEALK